MNCVLPSRIMPLEVIWGVKDLSTRIEVPALQPLRASHWDVVVLRGSFLESTPLVEMRQSTFPMWCLCKSRVWGGMVKEVTHALISFCFGEFFPALLTIREAMVMAFLFMNRLF